MESSRETSGLSGLGPRNYGKVCGYQDVQDTITKGKNRFTNIGELQIKPIQRM